MIVHCRRKAADEAARHHKDELHTTRSSVDGTTEHLQQQLERRMLELQKSNQAEAALRSQVEDLKAVRRKQI